MYNTGTTIDRNARSTSFAVTAFSIGAVNSQNAVGGDSVSTVGIEYGLVGRFRFVYGGIAAERTTESQGLNPVSTRWILGVSLSGFRGASKTAARSAMDIDKPRR